MSWTDSVHLFYTKLMHRGFFEINFDSIEWDNIDSRIQFSNVSWWRMFVRREWLVIFEQSILLDLVEANATRTSISNSDDHDSQQHGQSNDGCADDYQG